LLISKTTKGIIARFPFVSKTKDDSLQIKYFPLPVQEIVMRKLYFLERFVSLKTQCALSYFGKPKCLLVFFLL
jgi:hypothetical protein